MSEDFEDKKKVMDYRAQIQREQEGRRESDRHQRELMRQSDREDLKKLALEGNIDAIKLQHELAPERYDLDFEDHIKRENVRLQSYLQERNIDLKFTEVEERLKTDNQLKLLMGDIARSIAVKNAERKNEAAQALDARQMERLKHQHSMTEKDADHQNAKDLELFRGALSLAMKQKGAEMTEHDILAALTRLKNQGTV